MNWASLTFAERAKVRGLLEEYISQQIQGFEIIEKNQSLWMKFLSKLLFFTPDFMDRFITAIYPKVYIPSLQKWEANNYYSTEILCHEYVHLSDRKRYGLLFNFLYLTPQLLAIVALLYPLSPWFLLFLVCLLPLPSPGRAWAELRGYRMSMAVRYWLTGDKIDIDFIVQQFTGRNYYWMLPAKKWVENWFQTEYGKIINDELTPELREVKNLLTAYSFSVYNNLE